MEINKINNLFSYKGKVFKKYTTSGGSRNIFFIKNNLPLNIFFKHLITNKKTNSGRNSSGRIVMWTRKSKKYNNKRFNLNYTFRYKFLNFIGNIILLPFSHKLISLVFMSSGSISYVPTTENHKMFIISKFYGSLNPFSIRKLNNWSVPTNSQIMPNFFLLKMLQRNQNISLLELLPGRGIQYVRSSGSSAKMIKYDWKLNTGLVKLPSGVRKVFSSFSLASLGSVALVEKKNLKNNKAGYYSNLGRKPIVRGVAMNPVDHPHGGRTKAIRYPRTPWGKTTKFK